MHEAVSDNANTKPAWYIAALAYAAGKPAYNPLGLEKVVQETISALGPTPANICAASVKGRVGKTQNFSPGNLAALIGQPESGALLISGIKESSAHVDLRLYLRH